MDHTSDNPIDRRMMLGAGLLGAAALTGRTHAGPIDPPAGPVAPTGRTTDELYEAIRNGARRVSEFPTSLGSDYLYYLNEPGYYILDTDITVSGDRAGIGINSSRVVLDLNGHTIRGIDSRSVGVDARAQFPHLHRIHVRNGFINCPGNGVDADAFQYIRVENVHINGATSSDTGFGYGIRIGEHSVVQDCTVEYCRNAGIRARDNSQIKRCIVDGITNGPGIETWANCSVEDCQADSCGTHGILVGNNSTVYRCLSSNCTLDNIFAADSCVIERSTAAGSTTGSGVRTGVNCIVTGCTCRINDAFGIRGGEQNVLEQNSINANGSGVLVHNTSVCRKNLIDFHQTQGARGIVVYSDCIIEDNLVTRSYSMAHCLGANTIFRRNYFRHYTFLTEALGNNYIPTITLGSTGSATNPVANLIV